MIQTERNHILSYLDMMKECAYLDEDANELDLFLNKILIDLQKGFHLFEELFDVPMHVRRNGKYEDLKWRNDELVELHHLHIKYLKQWRNMNDENSLEKNKLLSKLLSVINAMYSGLKNTG